MAKKHIWDDIYRQHNVRNLQQLINKAGGLRPAGRLLDLSESTIRTKITYEEADSFNKPQRIFYFTDTHVQPKLETDHLKWIAQYIKDSNPDHIVHGGDFADAESLCSHILPHTLDARSKPSLKSDIACMEEAMLLISEISGRRDIHVTLGNHEERIWTMEKNNPDLAYLLQDRFDLAYQKAGWSYTRFGVYHTLCGVDFTHAPMMMSGKPVGGKLSINNVASNSVADCVYGHTHMKAELSVKKFGPDRQTTAVNGGCSMPFGYIPKYVQGGSSGWWHGVIELEVQHGKIKDTSFISLEKLKKRYG